MNALRVASMALPGIERAADIAQVVIGAAAVASLLVAAYSIYELRKDRSARVKPRVVFDRGRQDVEWEERPLGGIPGIDLGYATAVLGEAHLTGKPGRYPKGDWGRLTNHGNGSAFNVRLTFITLRATVGAETFGLDAAKLAEFPYAPGLNSIPASPSNLAPGGTGEFRRIPTPILVGPAHNRTVVQGLAIVSYTDLFDKAFVTYQQFRAGVSDETLVMTFGDEYSSEEASQLLRSVAESVPPELLPVQAPSLMETALGAIAITSRSKS